MECQSFSPNRQLKSTINKHTLTVKCRGQIGQADLPNSLDRATGCDSREVAKIGTLLPAGAEKSATTHLGF